MQGKHILLLDLNYVNFNFDCKFLKPFQGIILLNHLKYACILTIPFRRFNQIISNL